MQDFFLWVCKHYKINSEGTTKLYIHQSQQLYTTITGYFADRNDINKLYKVLICPIYPFNSYRFFLLTLKNIIINVLVYKLVLNIE